MGYYNEVVNYLQWCVMDVQRAGMLVDMDLARQLYESADKQMKQISQDFEELLGYPFNPNSSQQVMTLFNDDFMVELLDGADKLKLLKTQIKCPDAKPIVAGILDYRDLMKMKGTYCQPEPWPDGRVRSQLRTYGTLTWRLSSKEPDLQNMPREPKHDINIKDIYVSPKGKKYVEFDYAALEDRIPAYASGCEALIKIFESGGNAHLYRAKLIYGRDVDKKAEIKLYTNAKTIRYARGYGAGHKRCADQMLLVTRDYWDPLVVKEMIDKMDSGMPEIIAWHNKCWKEAEESGLLYDGFGIPRVLYSPPGDRHQVAFSWPVAATASGIINRAMVRIYHWLRSDSEARAHVTMVCQVHDSLLFEITDEFVCKFAQKIKELMEEPVTIFGKTVSIPTEAKVGDRWGTMGDLHV